VWRVLEGAIDWFDLVDGEYHHHKTDGRGIHGSTEIPGLWLDMGSLLANELTKVVARLGERLARPEHSDFVARLNAAIESSRPDPRS
jgi:hypothetical protein